MTALLYATVYAPDDLPTEEAHIASKSLGTVNEASVLEYKKHLRGSGALKISINRHHAQAALLVQDRYLIVHGADGPVGGGFLDEATVDLSHEGGASEEFLTWTGMGQMGILRNGRMDATSNIAGGHAPIDGYWALDNQGIMAGASNGHAIPMLKRALVEMQLNSPSGISVVDHSSWTYDLDSDAVAVPFVPGEVQGANVGDDALSLLAQMSQLGDAIFVMDHLFKLDAHLTYGTDKSGAFGAGTVRFEKGVNVAAAIARKVRGAVNRTHLIVGGAERTFVTAVDPSYVSGDVVRWGFLSVPQTADPDGLEAAGLAHIEARKRQTDTFTFPQHDHGDDPASGIYEPGDHYDVGYIVSHHTGTGDYDANEQASPVAAISWVLKTGDEANGDYEVTPEIGSTFHWDGEEAFTGSAPGSQHRFLLCEPGEPGVEPAVTNAAGGAGSSGYDQILVSVGAAQGGLYLVWLTHDALTAISARYQSTGATPATSVAMTLIATIEHPTASSGTNTDNETIHVFRLANPAASVSGFIDVDFTGTPNGSCLGYWVTDSDAVPSYVTASGTGTTSSVNAGAAEAEDMVLNALGLRIWSLGDASNTPTPESGQTPDWAIAYNHSAGQPDGAWAGGHKVGPGTLQWSWTTATNWVAVAIIVPGTGGTDGDCPEDVGDTCDVGTSVRAARCDHVHALGFHSADDEHAVDATQVQFEPTGTISSTNVQNAIAEAVAEAAGSGLGWYNVKDYGATGEGVADDTAEINLAIAAYNATGGVLYFPAGDYLVSAGLTTLTAPGIVRGDGMTASRVTCSSATANIFTVQSDSVHFRDLKITSSHGTPTAGAAIRVQSGGSVGRFENLWLSGMWTGIRHEAGIIWTMDRCYIEAVRKYGIHISNAALPDGGDWAIDNSAISAIGNSPDAAVRIDSSGGGKITNLKVNASSAATGFNHGIDLAIAGSDQTSILLVASSSIENVRGDGIHATQAGTSLYSQISVIGCQIALHDNNSGKAVSIVAEDAAALRNVVISSNLFATNGTARSAIQLTNVDQVTLVGNDLIENFTSLYSNSGSTNITEVGATSALVVQEDDVTVDAAAGTLDFTTALNVTSSPAGEANIAVDLGTGASQAAAGDHTHTAAESAQASGSGDVTTTASLADVTGATLSLTAGTYIVVGVFDTLVNNALNDRTWEGHLDSGGSDQNDYANLVAPGLVNVRATVAQSWRLVLASTTTVKLRTLHSGGTVGDFTVKSTNTTLTAYRAGGSGFAGAKAYNSTTQSIADATSTPITFDSEEYDSDAFHSTASNTSRFTVPAGKAGTYLLAGGTYHALSASPVTVQVWWRLNGTTSIRGGNAAWVQSTTQVTGFGATALAVLVVGDYVELMVYQDSSGARNIGHASAPDSQSNASITLQ